MTIDNDVLEAARAVAALKGYSLGRALSELARRGLANPSADHKDEAATVFAIPVDAEAISSEDVYRSLDDWP